MSKRKTNHASRGVPGYSLYTNAASAGWVFCRPIAHYDESAGYQPIKESCRISAMRVSAKKGNMPVRWECRQAGRVVLSGEYCPEDATGAPASETVRDYRESSGTPSQSEPLQGPARHRSPAFPDRATYDIYIAEHDGDDYEEHHVATVSSKLPATRKTAVRALWGAQAIASTHWGSDVARELGWAIREHGTGDLIDSGYLYPGESSDVPAFALEPSPE